MEKYIALLKAVEVGSFTKAAELLGYTQPALSQMIASLKKLSVKLLCRSRYGRLWLPKEKDYILPYKATYCNTVRKRPPSFVCRK